MRWIIVGVKYNFQPHQAEPAQSARHALGGRWLHAVCLSWWSHAGCDGSDVRQSRLGIAHGTIRFLLRCGQHWRIVGECLSVCVRVYQHLSCLLLRCAGCWLTALPRLLHISQLVLTRSTNRNQPTAAADQTIPITLLPLSIYKPLLHKVHLLYPPLLAASSFHILPFTV